MTIRGVFVGINRYVDPDVPELVAAADDATALWAVFADTFPDLQSQLLRNSEATRERVRLAIINTLAAAAPDDVVVISFAGHGSSDGSLVLHDTQLANMADTTLPMAELADAFASSPARAVLCVLDCCFSGQAPARVLEVPGLRSLTGPPQIRGEGRIMLAACSPTQGAYEQPGGGHGLLTLAILQAFTRTDREQIAFPDVGGEVIGIAGTEAARLGRVQTPEFLGHIQGGLVLPRLRKGTNYEAFFGKAPIEKISGSLNDFAGLGIPESIVNQWAAKFPNGLNSLQLAAVNDYGTLAGRSLMVVAPTSSGKTLIGELAGVQSVLSGRKAVFLLPYRALVNEKFDEFTERYGPAGLRVTRCSGDATDSVGRVLSGRYDICFFTYEMFLSLALASPRLLNQLGLVVVDEGQFITDPSRGITVELILTLLLRAKEESVAPQLLVLSAVIGHLNGFDNWLGLPVLRSEIRPVPLTEGVIDRSGRFQYRSGDGTIGTTQLVPREEIRVRRDEPSAQDIIVPLVRQLVAANEKVIVFRNTRGPAEGCANYLAQDLGLPPAQAVLDALPDRDLTSTSIRLRGCLEGGTAFHNANLLRAEREAVERAFRSPAGGISVLASTTTLAAGINTPASTVILAENVFVGEDGRAFTIAEYKNMAGRAGRLGFNETGKAIIYAETEIERSRLFNQYVLGTPENVSSSFRSDEMATWILRLLSQVRRGLAGNEIPTLLVNTFGGYTASRKDPGWVAHTTVQIDRFVQEILRLGLAEYDGNLIKLTLLGRACGASSLTFESSLRLIDMMRTYDQRGGAMGIVGVIQALDELDKTYTPLMKKGQREAVRPSEVSARYGSAVMNALSRFAADHLVYQARCKRAAIVYDWLQGDSVADIEDRYTASLRQGVVSYGDIVRIADATRYHLRSAHRILAVLFPQNPTLLAELDQVLERLELGLPAAALPLRQLPIPLERGQYLALLRAGCSSPEDAARLSGPTLDEAVGRVSAKELSRVLAAEAS